MRHPEQAVYLSLRLFVIVSNLSDTFCACSKIGKMWKVSYSLHLQLSNIYVSVCVYKYNDLIPTKSTYSSSPLRL